MTKKARYSEVYISGEVVNKTNWEQKWAGTPGERGVFRMDIEVAPNTVLTVEFDNTPYDFSGNPSKKYEAAVTIYNEYKTKAQDGQGDMVTCICKIDKQEYYSNGELKEFQTLKADYCSRQKNKSEFSQIWKIDTLIKSMEMKTDSLGDYLEVKGLINDYISTTGKIKGINITYKIHDAEIIEGFKSLYTIGSVAKLNGEFMETVIQADSKVRGFGRQTQSRPQIQRWMEILGGDESYNTIYDENTYEIKGIVDITDEKHPFSKDNIDLMETQIEIALQKSREKDAEKMANKQQISDSDVPF